MRDFDQLGKELLAGENGGKLKALADTPEARRLGGTFTKEDIETVKSGDSAALHNMLSKILATDEGKKLANQLSSILDNK